MEKHPVGTHVIAIAHATMSWAVTELIRKTPASDLAKLKVDSGEHLAAILATAFLGSAPVSIDTHGQADLVFNVTTSLFSDPSLKALVGRDDVQFADFEVKSLRGGFRQFNAEIDKAIGAGAQPRETEFSAIALTAQQVLRTARDQFHEAREQLALKSAPDRARCVFLIAHFLEHPIVECLEPIVADHLGALNLPEGVDGLWVLFAPNHLVVWSTALGRWTELILRAVDPDQDAPAVDEDLELLQHLEAEFLQQAGWPMHSSYFYRLTAGDS